MVRYAKYDANVNLCQQYTIQYLILICIYLTAATGAASSMYFCVPSCLQRAPAARPK